MLFLCVSLIGLRMPKQLSNMISGCVLWGCLLAFGSVDWANVTLINVGGHQAICWGPEQNKKSEEGWIFCLVAWAEVSIFSCPQISDQEIHHWCLNSQAFGFRLNYTTGFPACRWQRDCVTSCLPQTCEPILIINLLSRSILFVRFLWRSVTPRL